MDERRRRSRRLLFGTESEGRSHVALNPHENPDMNYAAPLCVILDQTIHPVTDDLECLESMLTEGPDDIEAFAQARGSLPAQLEMRGRAVAHLAEVRRLLRYLARVSDSVESWGEVMLALTYLHHAAQVATLLLPVRTADDRWVRDGLGNVLIERAEDSGDPDRMAIAIRATADRCQHLPAVIEADEENDLSRTLYDLVRRAGTAPRRAAAEPLAGAPAFHPLEHRTSLETFMGTTPDLSELEQRGREFLVQSDRFRSSRKPAAMREAAVEMARLLGYAQLIRAVLWPTLREEDGHRKASVRDLVRSRVQDPERLGAIFEIALDGGQTLSRLQARFEAMRQGA